MSEFPFTPREEVDALIRKCFMAWCRALQQLKNNYVTEHISSTVYQWKVSILSCGRQQASAGITLKRKRFGALLMAKMRISTVYEQLHEGSLLLEINGVIVVLETFQSIVHRLEHADRPISLRFAYEESVYDVTIWDRDLGIVWGSAADLAQVERVTQPSAAWDAGVRPNDLLTSKCSGSEALLSYDEVIDIFTNRDAILFFHFSGIRVTSLGTSDASPHCCSYLLRDHDDTVLVYSMDTSSVLTVEKKYVAIVPNRAILMNRWSLRDSVSNIVARSMQREHKMSHLRHCLPQILELVIASMQHEDGVTVTAEAPWLTSHDANNGTLSSILGPLVSTTHTEEEDGVWRTVPGSSPFSHLLHVLPTCLYVPLYHLLNSSMIRPRRRSSHLRKYLATSPTYLPNVPPPSDDADGDIASILTSSRNSILTALQAQYLSHLEHTLSVEVQIRKQQMLLGAIQRTVKQVSNELLHQRNFLVRDILRREVEALSDLFPLTSPLHSSVVLTSLLFDECYMLRSSRYPLLLVFESTSDKESNNMYRMLFKTNDDLRQDSFVMQLFRCMSDICLRDGIDLRLTFYDILPTSTDEVYAMLKRLVTFRRDLLNGLMMQCRCRLL